MHPLVYSDTGFHGKLRELLKKRAKELGVTLKEMAARCKTSEGALWKRYGGSPNVVETFSVLFNLCSGHELDLMIYLGSNEPSTPTYTVNYYGDMQLFKTQLGIALLAARTANDLTQRDRSQLNGAGQAQIHRIETGKGDTPKVATIDGIFQALGAKLILFIHATN